MNFGNLRGTLFWTGVFFLCLVPVGLVGTFAAAWFAPRTYVSKAIVEVPAAMLPGAQDTERLAALIGDEALDGTADSLGLHAKWGKAGTKLTGEEVRAQLRGSLAVKRVRNTQLLQIVFSSTDPNEAADVANALAEQFQKITQEKSAAGDRVKIWEKAQPAIQPSSSKIPEMMGEATGMALVFLIGGLALVLGCREGKDKSPMTKS